MKLGFDCHECDDRLKKERGCNEKGIVPFDVDGERVFRCPLKLVTDISWNLINAHSHYKQGFFPNGNNSLGETEKFLDAMIIIENELIKIQSDEMKKVSKK